MSKHVYNPEETHLGAVIFSGNAGAHPKMSDAEWDAMIAQQQLEKDSNN